MKYNKKLHEEKIAKYRSEANLKRIEEYQLDPEEYLEDQKSYELYAKLIERDVVEPYLNQNAESMKVYKKGLVRNGVLSGTFFLADLLTFTLAAVLKSPVPVWGIWGISIIGGAFASLGAAFMFSAIDGNKIIRTRKNENAKVSTEWNELKGTPAYVKEFMFRNGVTINGSILGEASAEKHSSGISSPLDEEWLF